jgi:hypothetical protein
MMYKLYYIPQLTLSCSSRDGRQFYISCKPAVFQYPVLEQTGALRAKAFSRNRTPLLLAPAFLPIVAIGKVYQATQSRLAVFGFLL